ncbi:hypothetical protein PIROE2DRAFT_5838, partial [Piromyces sp. E2]
MIFESADLNSDTIKKINISYNDSVASTKHKYKNLNEKNDISFYFQHINVDRIRYLLSGKKKNVNDNLKSMDNIKNIFSNSIMKLNDMKKNSNIQSSNSEKHYKKFLEIHNDFYDNEEEINIYNADTAISDINNTDVEDINAIENTNTFENDNSNDYNVNDYDDDDNNDNIYNDNDNDNDHYYYNDNDNDKDNDIDNVNDNDNKSININIIKSSDTINYLFHSKSMVEIKTRQICEEMENFSSTEDTIQMKRVEYENFMKNSMLINKVNEYQNSKHNHSLNYLKLRKSKSYSDFFETRENIE